MKALVLAGGFPQIELIIELKQRGYYVLLADYNEEPVAKKYADRYYRVSTLDTEAIYNIAKDEKVEFLITVCTDQALLTVAEVSERLGLPCYLDFKTGLNVTNKMYMKDIFRRFGISTAKHIVVNNDDADRIKEMSFPLIVKPVNCNSSKGVRRCNNVEEYKMFVKDAIGFSRTKTAIVEDYIAGAEISVDVYVENGKTNVLAVSCLEKIKQEDRYVIIRSIYPAPVSTEVFEKIQRNVQLIADAFELKNTTMLVQMLATDSEVYVIEFSARTGGGVKHKLIKRVAGFDVIKAIVDLTLGNKVSINMVNRKNEYLINEFLYCKEGVFDHLEGFEELKVSGIIDDYYLFKGKNAKFSDEIASSGDRVAGFTISSKSVEELKVKTEYVNNIIKVMDINGFDILRHDLIGQ